jgi:hypothetical protein
VYPVGEGPEQSGLEKSDCKRIGRAAFACCALPVDFNGQTKFRVRLISFPKNPIAIKNVHTQTFDTLIVVTQVDCFCAAPAVPVSVRV